MDIIVISDIHNDLENMLKYLDKIKELKFDVIICPGDFSDVNLPKGFEQEDIVKIIIEEFKILNKPILCVPGNIDTKEVIKLLEKEKISIHGKGKIIDNVGFYGYGGAKTPFGTCIEPSEDELKIGLEKAFNDVKDAKIKVQVTHNPPHGTRVDLIQSGIHVGSNVVREMIKKFNPVAAISAHIHEARVTYNLDNTLLMNSGKFSEGYFGLINIDKNYITTGKILNLNE